MSYSKILGSDLRSGRLHEQRFSPTTPCGRTDVLCRPPDRARASTPTTLIMEAYPLCGARSQADLGENRFPLRFTASESDEWTTCLLNQNGLTTAIWVCDQDTINIPVI